MNPHRLAGFLLAGLSLACASKTTSEAATEPAATETTACRDYTDAICRQAGTDSRSCQSTRSAVQLLHPSACAAALANLDYSTQKLEANTEVCKALVGRLCSDLGESTRACQLVQADLAQLDPDQCRALDGAYAEVLNELRELNASLAPLSEADQQALAAGNPPAFGSADAAITVVLFSDFECPYCATAAKQVDALRSRFGTEIRFVFRQFPLSFHPHARGAAEAALAAHAQGKFWEFHDRLFADQSALDRASLEAHAAAIGLDVAAFRQSLDAGTHAAAVDADFALGRRVNVEGTPTMFVNGERVDDATDIDSIAEAIDAARQPR